MLVAVSGIFAALGLAGLVWGKTYHNSQTKKYFSDAYYVTNIASSNGGPTAYVRFTANTTNTSGTMDFSDLQFTTSAAVPELSSLALLCTSVAALCPLHAEE